MTLPRTLVELSPFIALLGGIVGLGQLSKNSELTAIRSTGFSIFRIALVALVAGILWTVSLGAIDEWVASPLQQQALQIKSTATALGEDNDIIGNMLWARRGNEFVTVKSLNEQGQPVGVEIFHYRDDLSTIHPVRGYSAFFHTIVTQTAKKVPFGPESNCPESCRQRFAHWDSESSFSD